MNFVYKYNAQIKQVQIFLPRKKWVYARVMK